MLVAPNGRNDGSSANPAAAVKMPEYAQPKMSDLRREHLKLDIFEGLTTWWWRTTKLVGKSRRWITYEIQAGNLLSIPGWATKGSAFRSGVWPLRRQLIQSILRQTPRGVDIWEIYHACSVPMNRRQPLLSMR